MEELVAKFQTVVRDFSKIPKTDTEPTWLEICRYPQSRFEEICSRILAFFLNPKAEHGLNDLWLSALLDAIGKVGWRDYRHDIGVRTEEYADGKRIDITVVANDYVVAIENKITADLYNPLDVYKKHITEAYPGKKHALVVLSMKPILNPQSLIVNGFQRCSYSDLFNKVDGGIGNYISSANPKYLTFMIDFMKTINNMNNSITKMEYDFFSINKEIIDELINRYECYKAKIRSDQKEAIGQLMNEMRGLTGANWWTWEDWVLGVTLNEQGHKIGIESHFQEEDGKPLARFDVCITTWSKGDWPLYRDAVLNAFADSNPVEQPGTGGNSNRMFVWIYSCTDGDKNVIAGKLKDIYNKLSEITSNIH